MTVFNSIVWEWAPTSCGHWPHVELNNNNNKPICNAPDASVTDPEARDPEARLIWHCIEWVCPVQSEAYSYLSLGYCTI